jgi:hypothetical protein
MNKKSTLLILAAGSIAFSSAFAAVDLYVLRTDFNSANVVRPATMLQFNESGTLLNSWDVPSTDAATRATILRNSAYGGLRASDDLSYIVFGATDAAVGESAGNADHRVVGRFSVANGTVDTSTRVPGTSGLLRSVATLDGSAHWAVGNSAVNGVRYMEQGGTTESSALSVYQTAINLTRIHDGRLYISDDSDGIIDLGSVPFPGDANIPRPNNFVPIAGDPGVLDFFFFDGTSSLFHIVNTEGTHAGNTLHVGEWDNIAGEYVALDGANQTYTFDAHAYISLSPLASPTDDSITIYFTQGDLRSVENNSLYSLTWDTDTKTFGEATHIADAGEGFTFHGVVAIPEPGTYGLFFGAIAVLATVVVRRRLRS